MATILVGGALANKPFNGGEAWVRLSWALGLRRLGHRVHLVEEIVPAALVDAHGAAAPAEESVNLAYFRGVTRAFDLPAWLITPGGDLLHGGGRAELLALAESAALLVNISGNVACPCVMERIRRRAYIDIDPGFTQFWHAQNTGGVRLDRHDFHFTIGERIGAADCPVPTGGIAWRPIRQPVVLDDWPVTPVAPPPRFTTVASWRGPFGPVTHGGVTYGLKVHEFRKFLALPRRAPHRFELALQIHPAEQKDLALLWENGWRLVEPRAVASDPDSFRRYVQGSAAEFSAAQGMYVQTRCGWFSDRSVRYLASGKPVLVQDTGLETVLPTGEGLVTFRTLDEAVAGAEAIMSDYARHSRAARTIAEEFFDSDHVLSRLLSEVGIQDCRPAAAADAPRAAQEPACPAR